MKSLTKLVIITHVALCSYLVSCATPRKVQADQNTKSNRQGNPRQTASQQQSAKQKSVKLQTPKIDPYLLLQNLMRESFEPDEIEKKFLAGLSPLPKSGSIHEALMVLNSLREISKQSFSQHKLNQPPTDASKNSDNTVLPASNSIESALYSKGIFIERVFEAQPTLANSYVLKLLWNASLAEGNSEVFRQRVVAIVKKLTSDWPAVLSSVHVDDITVSPATTTSSENLSATTSGDKKPDGLESSTENNSERPVVNLDNPTPAVVPVGLPDTLPIKPTNSTKLSEKVLEAQNFAEKDEFQKAVQTSRSLPKDSAEYQAIKEQIVQWSNRGVIELRRKAANDFRTSQNVTDVTAKSSVLNKSRSNLLKALEEFPDATNLDTVRDNLRLVEQELDKLKQN